MALWPPPHTKHVTSVHGYLKVGLEGPPLKGRLAEHGLELGALSNSRYFVRNTGWRGDALSTCRLGIPTLQLPLEVVKKSRL